MEEQNGGRSWLRLGIVAAVAAGLFLLAWLGIRITMAVTAPGTEDFQSYLADRYDKDFRLIRRYTYTDCTDGENSRSIRWCPAAEFEDPETGVRFSVRARSIGAVLRELTWLGDWILDNDFSDQMLRFCAAEQGLTIVDDGCNEMCLALTNDRETAEKLQKMTVRFNGLCAVKPGSESCLARFVVSGEKIRNLHSVYAGDLSDRWLDQTWPFCYDTPIEKYEAFLTEALG